MTKKLLLFCLTFVSSIVLNAQTSQQMLNFCGTSAPPQHWDSWMNDQVEKFKQNNEAGKTQSPVRVIPVIVHVIFFNEGIGTYPNIDSNQIKSQIAALNQDFAGTGFNSTNVPAVFAGLKANTGIQFCLTQKDRQDQPQIPHGIERISASGFNWTNPNTPNLDLQNYFNTVIIPNTIWDPNKYLNIWISDKPTTFAPNGFATYPPASNLPGVFGGNIGNINNDGIWIWTKAFGTVGTLMPPYDKGRNATHEIGHWLGLRHTWGDGNCLTDYAGDTPFSKQANYGCVPVPTPADVCGVNTAPNGEMPMNFMDRSDDACMYMFTHDQNIRMQTALSQSPLRYLLGTHNKCALPTGVPSSSAVAGFTVAASQCLNSPFTPFNTSSGFPYPNYAWSASPAALFSPNANVSNPAITLTNPGSYTLTLVATNTVSSSSATFVVSAQNTCAVASFCMDSLEMIKKVDTLNRYKAPVSPNINGCTVGFPTGYLTGTNCYKDKEFAQFFPPVIYAGTPNPQVNSVIVLFDAGGTKAVNPAAPVTLNIRGGSVTQGPLSVQGSKSETLGNIIATPPVTTVNYIGKPGFAPISNSPFYPFRFDLNTPVIISSPNSGFFASVEGPNLSPMDSISILSNTRYNSAIDSSAWFLSSNLSWRTFKLYRKAKIQLAMIPLITCGPVGIAEQAFYEFNSNINVMPNPNNGLFSLVFTFRQQQQITINIYNSLGQQLSSSKLDNVLNNMVDVDLSDKPDGIYITEISNGSHKVVKKVVVSH